MDLYVCGLPFVEFGLYSQPFLSSLMACDGVIAASFRFDLTGSFFSFEFYPPDTVLSHTHLEKTALLEDGSQRFHTVMRMNMHPLISKNMTDAHRPLSGNSLSLIFQDEDLLELSIWLGMVTGRLGLDHPAVQDLKHQWLLLENLCDMDVLTQEVSLRKDYGIPDDVPLQDDFSSPEWEGEYLLELLDWYESCM